MTVLLHEDCINNDPVDPRCRGIVGYHAVSGGNAFPRCEVHWTERLASYENSDLERYANSDVAPSWFDPSYAGERWSEDD